MNKYIQKIVLAITTLVFSTLALGAAPVASKLPPEATAAVTALKEQGSEMIALFWPVLVAITVALILMKLFKKGSNRAT